MQVVDNAIAIRIIYLLSTPFEKWDAYKEGIIDEDGKVIESKSSPNWTMLHRLVSRIKVLIGKLPGGKTTLASLIAAYVLVREDKEYTDDEILIELTKTPSFTDYNAFATLIEDAPANATANVAGLTPASEPPARKKKILKRKSIDDTSTI
jgi:hypothetical protein